MSELQKYLIEKVKSHRLGSEAILLVAIIATYFSAALYIQTKPEAYNVLRAAHFRALVILVGSLWLATICWRKLSFRALRLISTGTIVLAGLLSSIYVFRSGTVEQLHINVIFDEKISLSPVALNKLISRLQSPLFNIEIDDRPMSLAISNSDLVSVEYVQKALSKVSIQSSRGTRLPILVTASDLTGEKWGHLLSYVSPEFIVISLWDVGSEANLSDKTVGRYVATTIAVRTLTAYAMRRNKVLLKGRTPGINRGCMDDFHRIRQTYILMIENPSLCRAEIEGIREVFGEASVTAIKALLNKISSDQ